MSGFRDFNFGGINGFRNRKYIKKIDRNDVCRAVVFLVSMSRALHMSVYKLTHGCKLFFFPNLGDDQVIII